MAKKLPRNLSSERERHFAQVWEELTRKPHITRIGSSFGLLAHILERGKATGSIDWTDDETSEITGIPSETVRDYRQKLEKCGYISHKQGRRSITVTIAQPWLSNLCNGDVTTSPLEHVGDVVPPKGDVQSSKGDVVPLQGDVNHAQKPSLRDKKEEGKKEFTPSVEHSEEEQSEFKEWFMNVRMAWKKEQGKTVVPPTYNQMHDSKLWEEFRECNKPEIVIHTLEKDGETYDVPCTNWRPNIRNEDKIFDWSQARKLQVYKTR